MTKRPMTKALDSRNCIRAADLRLHGWSKVCETYRARPGRIQGSASGQLQGNERLEDRSTRRTIASAEMVGDVRRCAADCTGRAGGRRQPGPEDC